MKEIMQAQGLHYSDFVISFLVDRTKHEVEIKIIFVPLKDYETKKNVPFEQFLMIKRLGCWLACDINYFFYGTIRRLDMNPNGECIIQNVEATGKDSMIDFIGQCLIEHMSNEKLTRKELCDNLKISNYKLNKIISGTYGNLALDTMTLITLEMQGYNKKREYKVLFEKYIDPTKRRKVDYCR
jgi:hypothetical protein